MFPQSFTKNTALPYYTYDQRGLLRNWSPQDGAQALVDSLGLFVYSNSNSQILDNNNVNTYQAIDDDESCFLTGNGAWLLEYPHWDLVNNWQLPDWEYANSSISALNNSLYVNGVNTNPLKIYTNATSGRTGFVFGSAVTTITSVAPSGIANQSITVVGASLGDAAIVNPSVNFTSAGVSVYCYVSAANTVTLYVTGIGGTVNLSPSAVWYVTVIKKS